VVHLNGDAVSEVACVNHGECASSNRMVRGLQLDQLLRRVDGVDIPVRSQDRHVLDPAAAETRDIYAGLDGDDVAGPKHSRVAPAEPGLFVDVETDAVAKGVAEGAGAARLDKVAGHFVHIFAHRAGADGVKRHLVRLKHGLVDVFQG